MHRTSSGSRNPQSGYRKGSRQWRVAISSLTLFETAQLVSKGRLRVEPSLDRFLAEIETLFLIKRVNAQVAIVAARLENYLPDPMDRLIGATAIVEGLPLVTADERIRQSGQIQTVW